MKKQLSTFAISVASGLSLLIPVETSLHAAAINWTNTASSGWDNAVNWDPNSVPGAGDTAVITNAGVTVSLNSGTTVGGIALGTFGAGTTTLSLNNQTLALNGPLTVYPGGSFTMDNGALVGNTNAVLSGTIGWSAASLGGTLTLAPGALLNITSGNNHDMPGCTMTNNGTVAWASGTIRVGIGSAVYNYGLWDAQSDQNFCFCGYGGGAVFNNYGTFRKSGGVGEFANATLFQVMFNQLAGVIDVQNGTNGLQLAFQGGGNFTGGYITTNQFGLTVLSAGSFNLNGTVTGTNTWEDAGNLVGTTVINGALTWVAGSWNNAPYVTIAANTTLIVAGGGGNMDLSATVVTNYGTVAWASGTIRGGNGTAIYNYGLWNAQSDGIFNDAFGNAGTVFNNYGAFRKSAGTNISQTLFQSGVFFNQIAGVVDVQSGNLVLQGSGNFTGGYLNTNTTGTTYLSSGSFNLNGTVTGNRSEEHAGNLVGTTVINGALTWVAGSWNDAVVTITNNSIVTVAGGGGNMDLSATVVTNYGTVAWASGTIRGGNGTAIYNYGLWNAQSDGIFNDAFGNAGTVFNNYGAFRKSAGTNISQTLFQSGVFFNQIAGVVDVQSGNLVLQGSGNFTGGYLNTNTTGTTYLSSGSFNLNGTVTGNNVVENAGNLVGTTVINGALTWVAGSWNDAVVTITNNSIVTVAGGGGNMDLSATVVTNYGAVAWASGTIRGGNGTAIYNYGLWNAQSDGIFNDAFGNAGTVFNNYGAFRKSAGTNISQTLFQSGVFFNQIAGVVDVQSGNLVLQGSGNFTGGYLNTNTTGTTYLSSGSFNLNGTVTGNNVVENAGNLVGTTVINGALTWVAGS